jgi:DnaK suppressor protein
MVNEMTRKEAILHLRNVLLRRRDALRQALAGDLSLLNELRGQSRGDTADFALDAAQDEISSQLAEVESRELANIENALECMREGKYGVCDNCEDNIPLARLQALPYATMCIRCQREAERTGVTRGVPNWERVDDLTPTETDVVLSDIEFDVT